MLCSGEWWDQEINSIVVAERAHKVEVITLWEHDWIGIEEGRDLHTVYWLSGVEQDHYLE